MRTRAVGRRTPGIEGLGKVNGSPKYAADVGIENCLWGRVVRSPYAHARIVRIDNSAAERAPGIRAVLTGAGHPHYIGRIMRDLPVLVVGKVRFIGERVAADPADATAHIYQMLHSDAAEEGGQRG